MAERPVPLWSRLGTRLAAAFFGLVVVLGVAVAVLVARSTQDDAWAADQALQYDLAAGLAPRLQPHLETAIDSVAIAGVIGGLTEVNRRIDVYLLGSNGMIKSWFADARGRPLDPVVDTAPLDLFLAGAPPPVLGPDPARPGSLRPFSAAPVRIMGEEGCYVYVVLEGERYDQAAVAVGPSALGGAAAWGLALALGLTALAGALVSWALTGRLRRLTETVGAFERGALSARSGMGGRDEVAALGRAFDRMAARIEDQVEALRRTDRQRRDLVANVSHDLRSPLAALRGYIETLEIRDGAAPEERADHVRRAARAAERLSGLVDDLFDLARFDAAEVPIKREPADLADLADLVVADCRPEAERRGVRLAVRAEDVLPLSELDGRLVERAVGNLLDNALRHTPPGGAVEVEVVRHDASTLAVVVRDTGRGIAPELLPRVFERFVRADESRPAGSSSGLGLAIVKRIAELHGGTVHVESTLGAGSAFSIVLPVSARRGRPAGPAPPDAPARPGSVVRSRSKRG